MTYAEMFSELEARKSSLFLSSDVSTIEKMEAFCARKGALDAALVYGRLEIREGLVSITDPLTAEALGRYNKALAA
jgi:hypothetical protein